MSAVVSGIVNSAIGLVCSEIRDYTAQGLDEDDSIDSELGDISYSELRQIVVRELNEIKTKLDGASRKDLLASLSFIEEGVSRLYISLETSGESCEKSSTSQAHTEDDESEGATAMTVKRVEGDVIDKTFQLRKVLGSLKIAAEEHYQSAEKSFEEAKSLAMQAFNNTALSTEDRVMAGKFRIASRILGCLDDPEAAVHDCLLYLKELQDLPGVKAMFTVLFGNLSRLGLPAPFNQTKRYVVVESVQAIARLLQYLILQYTNIKMAPFNWPTINIGREIYHPIFNNEEILIELGERRYADQLPWMWQCQTNDDIIGCAVTSTGKILTFEEDYQKAIKISKPNGESSVFCTIPSGNDDCISNKICCFAVDENDNVYVVIEFYSLGPALYRSLDFYLGYRNVPTQYKLLTFDENGNAKADRALGILPELSLPQMAVTKDGTLVIYCGVKRRMYVCYTTNAEKDYEIPLPLYLLRDDVNPLSFTVSDQNEIIYTFSTKRDDFFALCIITMDGELKHEEEVPTKTGYVCSLNVVFNHVNKTILVSLNDVGVFFVFSKSGKLLYKFKIPAWDQYQLTSHPNGPVALVDDDGEVMMLQM